MYRILLDDKFYKNQPNENKYLYQLLDIIKKYFDADIVIFEPFTESIKTYTSSYNGQKINQEILKTHKMRKFNLSDVVPVKDTFLNDLGFNEVFVGKINYILNKYPSDSVIIPYVYSHEHRSLKYKNYQDKMFFIGNIDEEIDSNIANWIKKDELIHIDVPSFKNKFPAFEFCNGFNEWRNEIIRSTSLSDNDKISTFQKIALEVATRNNYTYDSCLTALNKKKAKHDKNGNSPKRQIFKSKQLDVYLSTDFIHGGFEVYNKKPTHQGQFKFNGEFEKDSDNNTHPLYLK